MSDEQTNVPSYKRMFLMRNPSWLSSAIMGISLPVFWLPGRIVNEIGRQFLEIGLAIVAILISLFAILFETVILMVAGLFGMVVLAKNEAVRRIGSDG